MLTWAPSRSTSRRTTVLLPTPDGPLTTINLPAMTYFRTGGTIIRGRVVGRVGRDVVGADQLGAAAVAVEAARALVPAMRQRQTVREDSA